MGEMEIEKRKRKRNTDAWKEKTSTDKKQKVHHTVDVIANVFKNICTLSAILQFGLIQ